MKLVLLFVSIIAISIGVTLIISMDILPTAPDGLVMAISYKTDAEFSKVKVFFDCASVIVAGVLCLAFSSDISIIREGTIISALLNGKCVGIVSRRCRPWLKKVAFYYNEELNEKLDEKLNPKLNDDEKLNETITTPI